MEGGGTTSEGGGGSNPRKDSSVRMGTSCSSMEKMAWEAVVVASSATTEKAFILIADK